MAGSAELDKVIKMLISGISEEATRHACVEKFGLDQARAAELVVEPGPPGYRQNASRAVQ